MFIYVFPIVFGMEKRAKREKYSLPEPPSPSIGVKRETVWLIVIIALMIVALIGSVDYDKVSGNLVYRDNWYGYSGGGFGGFGFSFRDIYARHGYIIDAALFLIIFLGVGKGVFKKHFGEGGTPVYVGIGIFLAFALLLWEERSELYLLEQFGPLVVVMFVLVLGVWAYHWMQQAGLGIWPTLAIGYLIFYFFLTSLGNASVRNIISKIGVSNDWLSLLAVAAVLILIISIIHKIWGKKEEKKASS